MGFSDSLQNSPNNSGIYGSGRSNNNIDLGTVLSVRKKIQDEEDNSFYKKNQFMADLSNRQNRLQQIFNPASQGPTGQPANVVFNNAGGNPTTAEQDINKDLNAQKQNAQLEEKAKLNEGALKVKSDQEKLNQQKSDQINSLKHQELQKKTDEANSKLDLAERTLQSRQGDTDTTMKFHQAQMDALKSQHELENHRRDSAAEEAKRVHDANIKAIQDKLDAAGSSTTETSVDESGRNKTVKTTKGSSKRVGVTHPDGTHGTIDAADSKNLPEGWKLD
jgi:hypothetical protein